MRKHTAKKQKLKNNKKFLKRGARLYFYMVIKRGSNGKKTLLPRLPVHVCNMTCLNLC